MLTTLFVLTVVTLIVAYHFLIQQPKRRRELSRALAASGLGPPSALMERLPRGVFLQPTFTWSEFTTTGELLLGVHPMLLGLVGVPYELEVVARERVRKGAPLIRIKQGSRSLTLRSPINGKVAEVRQPFNGNLRPELASAGGDAWLCRVEPADIVEEIPTWTIADAALDWTQRQYVKIRDHLLKVDARAELGLTAADGGEIPVGILKMLDEAEWRVFEDAILRG